MNIINRHWRKIFCVVAVVLTAAVLVSLRDNYLEYKYEKARWKELNASIIAQAESFKGNAYIVIKDYNRNWRIDISSHTPVPAASIIKIPIMSAVFSAQVQGIIDTSQRIRLKQIDKTGGSGILKNKRSGSEYSILELIELMMNISDNTATNIIINLLGFDYINTWFKLNALNDTHLARLMMDMASRDKGIENYTTAHDISVLLDRIYNNKMIDEDVSSECLRIMKKQKTKNRIPAKLPKGTVVAHKTGLENGVCHDAGIVYTENGNFLICVLTRHNNANSYKSRQLISNIAYTVYRYYVPE